MVRAGDATIGDPKLAIIAGPCGIESREQAFAIAKTVQQSGAQFLSWLRLETSNVTLHVPGPGR